MSIYMKADDIKDLQFREYIRDIGILLGGKLEIADLLLKPKVTNADDTIKVINYTLELMAARKKQLVDIDFGNRVRKIPELEKPYDDVCI